MRPTFLGFETSKRGLMINQKGIDIVGNNVANLGVTGYTRQRVDQVSISTNTGLSRYSMANYAVAGQGASIRGIAQLRDPYLDKRFREENSDTGYYNKMSEILSDVEDVLDETTNDGLKTAISKFYGAVSTLNTPPLNITNANVVRTTAKSITQVLHQFDIKLDEVSGQQKYDTEVAVDSVNTILQKLANINDSISKETLENAMTGTNYYGPNELMDQRNVLLDELSQYGEILVTTLDDNTVEISMAGHKILSGTEYDQMNYVENIDNTVSLSWQSTGGKINTATGSLSAALNMINGRGPNATGNENYERGIPYYKDQLADFAVTMADAFNNVIPKFDQDGKPVTDVNGNVVYKMLFNFDSTAKPGASSINISDDWNDDPGYILTLTSEAGRDDNTYYTAMVDLFDKQLSFGGGFKGTLEEFVKSYSTTVSEDKNYNESRLTTSIEILGSVQDSIAQVSGVSMDEEGADLMAYQKAYSAMSRVMTALDEALDVLINNTGLVGR